MLNFAIGSSVYIDGRTCLVTRRGEQGHAIYGPYRQFSPGHYAVEFDATLMANTDLAEDSVCGNVDVSANSGRHILERRDVTLSALGRHAEPVRLEFNLDKPEVLEFRLFTNGTSELLVSDCPRIVLVENAEDAGAKLSGERFPSAGAARPAFLEQELEAFRRLHGQGCRIEIRNGDVVVSLDDVSFYAREPDDLRFVDEIFFRRAYNILIPNDACVIDVGMNIGLVSMTFARKPNVKEVHAFEPFKATYDRAVANLSLNPELAAKIRPYNIGLLGRDETMAVTVGSHGDSGRNSAVFGSDEGTVEQIVVRDAAAVLGPLIAGAEAKGRHVVAKIDCEGGEFDIFAALAGARLLERVTAYMVEWHRASGRTQSDLIQPLLDAGFVVFDLSGASDNGFFYAVRTPSPMPAASGGSGAAFGVAPA